MIDISIDGRTITVERGATILEAAGKLGVNIPTLCHHEGLPPDGHCRLCVVEIEDRGWKKLVASCMYPIKSEIKVATKNERVIEARRFIIQLLLNRNPKAISIAQLAKEYGVEREARFAFDEDLCIRCNRCVRACEVSGASAIGMAGIGFNRHVTAPYAHAPVDCIGCLSCATVCPTGKITYKDKDSVRRIWDKEFELIACERCGARYATREQIDYVDRLGTVGVSEAEQDHSRFCDKCRKAVYGKSFK